MAVVGFVTYEPAGGETVSRSVAVSIANDVNVVNPLDQMSSVDIAVHVAQVAGLDPEEVIAARNEADSQQLQLAVTTVDDTLVNKPQIVTTDLKSRKDIITYKVKAGDTVTSVARAHGITSDSVRWSNGLNGDSLEAGQTLVLPPVNGIVYTVKQGDTIDELVRRYSANKSQLIADNDAEVSGLKIGTRILIRGGEPPAPVASGYNYYSGYSRFAFGSQAVYGYNGYTPGQCTWYIANKRSIPANWGNAYSWDEGGRASGFVVNKNPAVGAILQDEGSLYYTYHVAYVEEVLPDRIRVTSMNVNGPYSISTEWFTYEQLRNAGVDFIH